MFCANCGKKMPDDAKFCPNCGHAVDEAEQKAQKPDEAPAEAEAPQPPTPTPVEPAPAATQPPSVTPQPTETSPTAAPPSTTTPQPTPSTPQPTPTPGAQPTPQAPGAGQQVPPPPPPPVTPQPAPPAGVPPTAQAPKKGGGKCWLIGCGILLVLGILVAVVGTFMCKKIDEQATATLQNTIDIWEPGEEQPSGEAGESGGAAGIIERLGEAAEGLQEAMSEGKVEGFDPSSVDADMLPTFYGFMVALAKDDPNAMHKYMSPSYQQEWQPDNWEPAPHIKHLRFRMQGHTKVSDAKHEFVITETIRDTNDNTEGDIVWYITFSREDGKWYVTNFE